MIPNKSKTYAIIEKQTGKVVIYRGEKQYFRTKATILEHFPRIKKDLRGIDVEIVKLK